MAKQIEFSIDKRVFEKFPEYRRAILVVTGVDNSQSSTLGEDIAKLAESVKNSINLEDPRIVAWREAFGSFGIKARDFRPSIDALVRRILNDKPLGSISPIVDVGTLVSLKFILPAGAHPILSDTARVHLGLASGDEVEVSDGIHPSEQVLADEPILLDNQRVATRRWVWRQTNQSRIHSNTHDFFLNIDALGIISEDTLNNAISYSKQVIANVFNKDCKLVILSARNPVQNVEV